MQGAGGGSITVNAQNLEIGVGSGFLAGIREGLGSLGAKAENIEINTAESVKLQGNFPLVSAILNQVNTKGLGDAGDVIINTGTLEGIEGFTIGSFTSGRGNAGRVIITAKDKVFLDGGGISGNGILSGVLPIAIGNGGDININAPSLSLSNRAQIATSTLGQGNAGNIQVNVAESVSVSSRSNLQAITGSSGNAGNITIEAEKGTVSFDGLESAASTSVANRPDLGLVGTGQGGNLTIKANTLSVTDEATLSTNTFSTGDAGDVNLSVRQLLVRDGASISTDTLGAGNAGSLRVNATESVQLIGTSADGQFSSGLLARTLGKGNAGELILKTRQLSVRDGAGISTTTIGTGKGGRLSINATDSVQLIGTSANGTPSNIASQTAGIGNAGELTINTRHLLVRNGGFVSSQAISFQDFVSEGNAGDLTINAAESVQLIGTSAIGVPSSLTSQTSGKGNAGELTINTRQLLVRDGAAISSATAGEGNGGILTINANESVQLIGTSTKNPIVSTLSTSTVGKGNAGNLILNTRRLLVEDKAEISAATAGGQGGTIIVRADRIETRNGGRLFTTTFGGSDAGDILLQVKDSVTLTGNNSGLFANTTQGSRGNGGNIFIYPQTLTISDEAAISVNSQGGGTGGKVTLQINSLTLDNGTISAETASTQGGNLTLNIRDLLFLRNGSQISTTAGTAEAGGDGGNIFIDAGSIAAIPQENSDITANAFLGDGGGIVINTESIFGIDFRQQLTPLSDITASSQAGRPGEVIINTSGIEPTRGLENLTEERINVNDYC